MREWEWGSSSREGATGQWNDWKQGFQSQGAWLGDQPRHGMTLGQVLSLSETYLLCL